MKRPVLMLVAAAAVYTLPAAAQNFEFAAMGGGSFHTERTVTGPAGSADAGFKTGVSAGAAFGHNMYNYLGGEIRYTFQSHDMKLDGSGGSAAFSAISHALHYDLVLHAAPKGARVRPYLSGGGGVKQYRGTGQETRTQPLSNLAILSKTDETVGMASFGAGVKLHINEWLQFRVDVRDYFSPLPTEVIAPVPGAKLSGWVHNIVPMAGLSFRF